MFTVRAYLFGGILAVYLAAGILFATLTPRWQAPDEPAHYNYVRHLAAHARFPELVASCYSEPYLAELKAQKFPPNLSIEPVCYEYHQPPLYYLLASPVFLLTNGSLLAVRLFSVTLGAGVIILAFFIGKTTMPDIPAVAYGTMAFVAFVPMHLAILSSVNNDALAELIFAAILLLLVRFLRLERLSIGGSILLGLLLGLGLLTKTTIYIAAPLVAVMLVLRRRIETGQQQNGRNSRSLLTHATIIYGLAFLVALPWFVRNASLYGNLDILGLQRHDDIVVGQLRTADFVAEMGEAGYLSDFGATTFRSFWGQFGWMAVPMDPRTYFLLALLTIIAAAGVLAFFSSLRSRLISTRRQSLLILLASSIFFSGLAYSWYNLSFVQFQGRYLFPSLVPLGVFFSVGIIEALKPKYGWVLVVGLALALGWVGVSAVVSTRPSGLLDKWTVMIIGTILLLGVSRMLLKQRQANLTTLLLLVCYAGLGLLALAAPFWFVVPYL